MSYVENIIGGSPFGEVVGNSVKSRVLFFFFLHPLQDYNKTEIAKHCGISRKSVYPVIESLMKYGIIKDSRKIGNTYLYTVDRKSPVFKSLFDFNQQLVKKAVDLSSRDWEENNAEMVLKKTKTGYSAKAELDDGSKVEETYSDTDDVSEIFNKFSDIARESLGVEHVYMSNKSDESIVRELLRASLNKSK